ncbi:hypothetical protein Q4E93_05510 [Flavitalea sp. BT771]|uniref:hypothetical protein n=1 Tax=Flavitalea sp. BT771 TaxID=3063329 RepID=UPI0026E1A0EA|nr:hypothetical protein [Flavitalea sp. BT771]MDO6430030.1 hypothetical protein [Flavitalea sp. BT771]MDV6219831.1 hypothetical protein [Flavitalea sp. BT771]
MPALLNTSLFIHREVRTNGFNNLICIAHPVAAPGMYHGDVYLQKTFLGRFHLHCEANSANRQVNIDLSHFDPLFHHRHAHMRQGIPGYSLAPGGPLVLHATEHHNGLYVVLEKVKEERNAKSAGAAERTPVPVFDSRKLMNRDYVMLRPVATGDFLLRSEAGQHQVRVHVNTADEGKYYHPSKLDPVWLRLSADGFNESSVSIQPFQLILIAIEVSDARLEFTEVLTSSQ